jgi:hypothetical protein
MNGHLLSHLAGAHRSDLTRRAAERHTVSGTSIINRPTSRRKSRRGLGRFAR